MCTRHGILILIIILSIFIQHIFLFDLYSYLTYFLVYIMTYAFDVSMVEEGKATLVLKGTTAKVTIMQIS